MHFSYQKLPPPRKKNTYCMSKRCYFKIYPIICKKDSYFLVVHYFILISIFYYLKSLLCKNMHHLTFPNKPIPIKVMLINKFGSNHQKIQNRWRYKGPLLSCRENMYSIKNWEYIFSLAQYNNNTTGAYHQEVLLMLYIEFHHANIYLAHCMYT